MVGVHPEVLESDLVSARRCERQSATRGMIYLDPCLSIVSAYGSMQNGNTIQLASKERELEGVIHQNSTINFGWEMCLTLSSMSGMNIKQTS